jgi:glutaconate CoA-transferase subunit A
MGKGRLFTDPDPERAREFFRGKSRSLTNKVMSVRDAVSKFVKDGDYFASGGFGTNRISTAVLHDILRQGRQNLAVAGHTATHDFQILCAGNMMGKGKLMDRVDAAYIVGLEARGLSPHARRVMESGEVEVSEWTNYTLACRFRAAAMGVPFIPARSMMGTDTLTYSGAKEMECPFTGIKLVACPALYPDVAAIHVHEADVYGNCRIKGISVADLDVARAAKRLIITTERLVSNDEVRSDPTSTSIPFYSVDAVCVVPYGSYPGNMPYEYFSDEGHLREWLQAEGDVEGLKKFLDKYIYNTKDFNEYLQLNGGLDKMEKLRRMELLIDKAGA